MGSLGIRRAAPVAATEPWHTWSLGLKCAELCLCRKLFQLVKMSNWRSRPPGQVCPGSQLALCSCPTARRCLQPSV